MNLKHNHPWSNLFKIEVMITSFIVIKLWSHDHIYNIICVTKKIFLVAPKTETMTSWPLKTLKYGSFKEVWSSHFNSHHQNCNTLKRKQMKVKIIANYILNVFLSLFHIITKIANFWWKYWCQLTSRGVSRDLIIYSLVKV